MVAAEDYMDAMTKDWRAKKEGFKAAEAKVAEMQIEASKAESENKSLRDMVTSLTNEQERVNKQLRIAEKGAEQLEAKLKKSEDDRQAAIEAAIAAEQEKQQAFWIGELAKAQHVIRKAQHKMTYEEAYQSALTIAGIPEVILEGI